MGIKVFHTPQGLLSGGLKQIFFNFIERVLRPFTYRYVFNSLSEVDMGYKLFKASGGVVIPPVIEPPLCYGETCNAETFEGRDAPIVVGFMGRLVKDKRALSLVRCFKDMPKKFHLTIYGDGPELNEIKLIAHESEGRIKVLDFTDRWSALSELDIFTSWSKFESFGIAVSEAMALGIPCLLSDVSGHRDLAGINLDYAWLFRAENDMSDYELSVSFKKIFGEMLLQNEDRLKRAKSAQMEIRRLCNPTKIAEDLFSEYYPRK
jgi:glycosyltransferase involved in cell wall biosynthesis